MAPVITDFGESRFLNGGTASARGGEPELTLQPGNLRWMAPEIFAQSSQYTTKADVFSYGLVCWELVAYRVPFEEMKPAAAAAAMAFHHQRPAVPGNCPQPLQKLMAKAWRFDPADRPTFADISIWLEHS